MPINVPREVATLQRMTVPQLRHRYAEVYGETTNANNRQWLVKRIAWRLQAQAEGGLSERARRRAAELANDADLRMNPPPPKEEQAPALPLAETIPLPAPADHRLPPPGTVLTRPYKGKVLQVLIREDGFEFEGQVYPSLSAVAKAITGSHCNGFLFFKLNHQGASA
jgi:hypothetical protein